MTVLPDWFTIATFAPGLSAPTNVAASEPRYTSLAVEVPLLTWIVTVSFGPTLAADGIDTVELPTCSFQPVMSTDWPLVFWIVSVGSEGVRLAPMIRTGAAPAVVDVVDEPPVVEPEVEGLDELLVVDDPVEPEVVAEPVEDEPVVEPVVPPVFVPEVDPPVPLVVEPVPVVPEPVAAPLVVDEPVVPLVFAPLVLETGELLTAAVEPDDDEPVVEPAGVELGAGPQATSAATAATAAILRIRKLRFSKDSLLCVRTWRKAGTLRATFPEGVPRMGEPPAWPQRASDFRPLTESQCRRC